MLSVVHRGRHRHFRLASPTVADMIDGIVAVALERRPQYRLLSRQANALSAARICYDHLAGRLGLDLTDSFVAREYALVDGEAAEIMTAGRRFLAKLSIGKSNDLFHFHHNRHPKNMGAEEVQVFCSASPSMPRRQRQPRMSPGMPSSAYTALLGPNNINTTMLHTHML